MATIEKQIQDALVTLLSAAYLPVDDRDVTIARELPDERLSQRALPLVVVDRPSLLSDAPWGYGSRLKSYTVPILCVDGSHVSVAKLRDSKERVQQLRDNVLQVLHASRHFGLATIGVFESLVTYDVGDDMQDVGNNLHALSILLTIPCTIAVSAPVAPDP